MIAVGVDPGGMTGLAIVSRTDVLLCTQGLTSDMLREVVRWYRSRAGEVVAVGIESAHVAMIKRPGNEQATPLNAQSSLSVAHNAGRIDGALEAAGMPRRILWQPQPSEWRKLAGVVGRKREDAEADARARASRMMPKVFTKAETHSAEALLIACAALSRHAAEIDLPVWRNR